MHRNRKLHIKSHMKVLEIGAGGKAHALSSLIVDKYIDEDCAYAQRGNSDIIIDRPFVKAEACCLPFPAKSFDYVIASHVIEHIPTPEISYFLSELRRVAHAGYIEAPTVLFECLLDIPEHNWIVSCKNNVLHLCEKRERDLSPLKRFIKPICKRDPDFWKYNISRYDDLWLTGMEWSNTFDYVIHDDIAEIISLYDNEMVETYVDMALLAKQNIEKMNIKAHLMTRVMRKLKRTIKSLFQGGNAKVSAKSVPWRSIVVCPYCYGQLKEAQAKLSCAKCNKHFPILSGDIPSFVGDGCIRP